MRRLRQWIAIAVAVGGVGAGCQGGEEGPSAKERQARSEVLRGLLSSKEQVPTPGELEAQRRDLRAEVGPSGPVAQGGSGPEVPTAQVTGQVEWVGDDELLLKEAGGEEREVRVEDETRFLEQGHEVSRRTVEEGAQVRVAYAVVQGEWIAKEVALLSHPSPPMEEGQGEGVRSPSFQR
jgi:hypothetical protein